jgi:hypothetical protein
MLQPDSDSAALGPVFAAATHPPSPSPLAHAVLLFLLLIYLILLSFYSLLYFLFIFILFHPLLHFIPYMFSPATPSYPATTLLAVTTLTDYWLSPR